MIDECSDVLLSMDIVAIIYLAILNLSTELSY
jgi:hypothetical protein